jgi:hypothetical protein
MSRLSYIKIYSARCLSGRKEDSRDFTDRFDRSLRMEHEALKLEALRCFDTVQ